MHMAGNAEYWKKDELGARMGYRCYSREPTSTWAVNCRLGAEQLFVAAFQYGNDAEIPSLAHPSPPHPPISQLNY